MIYSDLAPCGVSTLGVPGLPRGSSGPSGAPRAPRGSPRGPLRRPRDPRESIKIENNNSTFLENISRTSFSSGVLLEVSFEAPGERKLELRYGSSCLKSISLNVFCGFAEKLIIS